LSGRKTGNCSSQTPPRADNVSFNPGQVGTRFGWVEVTSPERRYTRGWSGLYIQTRCTGCGSEQWQNYRNLACGRSKGCQACSQQKVVPTWLLKRVTAMRQRCQNPKDAGYRNYGARGIRFEFSSVLCAARWIQETLGLKRGLELDRLDNDGPYAPGNIRYLSKSGQMRNSRRSKLTQQDEDWIAEKSPLAINTSRRLLSGGYSREQIVIRADLAVRDRRKNWRAIQFRLELLGYTTSWIAARLTDSP